MDKARKPNWSKEEECTLIESIELAGDTLKGTGNCAEINKKKKKLWLNITDRVNSLNGNNRDTLEIRKKWNNLKLGAKSLVDASHREAFKTGGGTNEVGIVGAEDTLILSLDKDLSSSERVSNMLQNTPAFNGITGAVDNFKIPSEIRSVASEESYGTQLNLVPPIENVTLSTAFLPRSVKNRKRKRISSPELEPEIPNLISAADLLPLQQRVLSLQMDVFSEQLKLIKEQREYYKLKREKLEQLN